MSGKAERESTGADPLSQQVDSSDSSDVENNGQEKPQIPDPPNGGLTAWLQVAGAFLLFFNSW